MMKRSPEEIAALRESFRKMDTAHKLEHIYTYHKWTILLILIALYILGSTVHRELTKKEPVLYLGLVNVAVGEDLNKGLTLDFLDELGTDPRRTEVLVYSGLYLSEDAGAQDHQYAYASRMKVMASVNAKKLDVVLMNQEAYDLLSGNEYLLPLEDFTGLPAEWLRENDIILEDNAIDYDLNQADEHRVVTESCVNAIEISSLPFFRDAGFSGTVYAGIIANTPRTETCIRYLEWLAER